MLCFVDDGSIDNTKEILFRLKELYPNLVQIVSYEINQGKAEAVRIGMLKCLKKYDCNIIGYIDADLAVSLNDTVSLIRYINKDVELCFYSRIDNGSNIIKAKIHRKLIGKIIRFFINNLFLIKYRDTQCGCKIFSRSLSIQVFQEKFISTWLFDIEIFLRVREIFTQDILKIKVREIPAKKWIDIGKSKVKISYFFNLWIDMMKIYMKYYNTIKNKSNNLKAK